MRPTVTLDSPRLFICCKYINVPPANIPSALLPSGDGFCSTLWQPTQTSVPGLYVGVTTQALIIYQPILLIILYATFFFFFFFFFSATAIALNTPFFGAFGSPFLRIFSSDPAAIRFFFAAMFAYNPGRLSAFNFFNRHIQSLKALVTTEITREV